ncbi:SGNH/GDSL hydrolase family protein [Rhodoferax sp.]|uniref:SGNH/GDSL hydrolase family protein n=1 Tax=Rhodoferax sp. TaxID=50421 RepID=UPI00374CB46F
MNWIPTKMLALSAAMLLAACGGGGSDTSTKVTFSSMVNFGDSLSDVGTYKVGAIAAAGGGKFTVNGTTTGAVNWTELLAAQLNLAAPCPAQTGLLSSITGIPLVAVSNNTTCTSYAQGSSRVTSTVAPNSYVLGQLQGQASIGLMAVPVQTQIATQLSAHGNYTGKELVTVLAGANDIFMHLNAVSAVSNWVSGVSGNTQATALAAGGAAGWTSAELTTIAAGGAAAVQAAATAAVTHSGLTAGELASGILTSVTGKGAQYVVVVNIPAIEKTPLGLSLGASSQTLLQTMVTTFNSTLQTALASNTNVLIVDAYTQSVDQYNNPAQYGLVNVTTPICSATGNILGKVYALTCNTSNLVSGQDLATSEYADDVHPTPAGYKLLNRLVALKMAAKGWL